MTLDGLLVQDKMSQTQDILSLGWDHLAHALRLLHPSPGAAMMMKHMALTINLSSLQFRLSLITLVIVGASLFLADFIDRYYVAELARESFRSKTAALLLQIDQRTTKATDLRKQSRQMKYIQSLYENNPELLLVQLYGTTEEDRGRPFLLASQGDTSNRDAAGIPPEVDQVLIGAQPMSDLYYDDENHRLSMAVPVTVKGQIVGAVFAEVWTGQFDAVEEHRRRWSWYVRLLAGGLIVMAVNLFLFVQVHRPLRRLRSAVTAVAQQDLSTSVPVPRQDEIGQVAGQFNLMVEQLRKAAEENQRLYRALQEANETLQGKVEEATGELVKRNEDLEKLNELLSVTQRETSRVQRLAVLGQTVATVAHRIGTPLTAISGHVQLLEEEPSLNPESRERIRTIMGQIERMSRIIQDLLTLARKPRLTLAPVDVNVMVEAALNVFRPVIDQQNIKLVTEFGRDLPPVIGDGAQLQEACFNLIDNALEAMPKGGRLMVRTACEPIQSTGQNRTWLGIEIADSGIGIDPHHLDRVFEPFFTTKGKGQGTGLGLTIANEAIRLHGGRLTVKSEWGKGSLFQIFLPTLSEDSDGRAHKNLTGR